MNDITTRPVVLTSAATNPQRQDNDNSTVQTTAGLAGAGVFLCVIIFIVVIRKRINSKQYDAEMGLPHDESILSEDDDVFMDKPDMDQSDEPCLIEKGMNEYKPRLSEILQDQNISDDLRSVLIDNEHLSLGKIIGSGQFGCVYEGKLSRSARNSNDYGSLTHEHVAIKTIKDITLDRASVEDFLKEGLLMRDFSHPNVLSLAGVAIADAGMPMIVLPFMANGSLKTYIMKPKVELTVRNLLDFGLQVAKGMNYLAQQKFVHRDLAARNCMLSDDFTVKVADFGLSRDVYVKEYYCSEDHKAKLPVKWMAIESLSKSIYTSKSDVWSYGVLLWELLTRGVTPYPDVSNWDMNKYLRSGRRLEAPQHCPPPVYTLMNACWSEQPRNRPQFHDIMQRLSVIMAGHSRESRPDPGTDLYLNITPHPPQRRRSSRRHRIQSK